MGNGCALSAVTAHHPEVVSSRKRFCPKTSAVQSRSGVTMEKRHAAVSKSRIKRLGETLPTGLGVEMRPAIQSPTLAKFR
jgi:hypothetical protein